MSQITSLSDSGGGGLNVQMITADVGVVIPVANNVNAFGAHGINTLGVGDTLTIAINNAISLGDLVVIPAATDALTLTTGDLSVGTGNINFLVNANATGGCVTYSGNRFMHNAGANSAYLGDQTGNFTGANGCVGIGQQALFSVNGGNFNTAVGFTSMAFTTTGLNNVAVGTDSLVNLVTGNSNVALGFNAGNAYTTNESNNIVIGNTGVIADSARIRIGTGGTHTSCFVAGIDGVNVGSVATVVTEASNQLGTASITGAGGITINLSANQIQVDGSGITPNKYTYTNVNTTPYVVQTTDVYLSVDCSGGVITVQLPNAATLGQFFIIKDRTGSAAANNITVTTVGGAVNIDGATTFVMNTAYESIQVMGNGSTYEIF